MLRIRDATLLLFCFEQSFEKKPILIKTLEMTAKLLKSYQSHLKRKFTKTKPTK
jgi:hypothetical protein